MHPRISYTLDYQVKKKLMEEGASRFYGSHRLLWDFQNRKVYPSVAQTNTDRNGTRQRNDGDDDEGGGDDDDNHTYPIVLADKKKLTTTPD